LFAARWAAAKRPPAVVWSDWVEDVSLTVIEHGHPRSVVMTGRLAIDLVERQCELGFGPLPGRGKTGAGIIVDTGSDDSPYPGVRPYPPPVRPE
jgi:hypothetical protein